GRTDGMTYNCGSHVAPPLCNSVRACRLLLTVGRPVLFERLLLAFEIRLNSSPKQFGHRCASLARQFLEPFDKLFRQPDGSAFLHARSFVSMSTYVKY